MYPHKIEYKNKAYEANDLVIQVLSKNVWLDFCSIKTQEDISSFNLYYAKSDNYRLIGVKS